MKQNLFHYSALCPTDNWKFTEHFSYIVVSMSDIYN